MTSAFLEIIKALASLSSLTMNLSPSPSMYKIHKEKSCGEVQVLPLLSFWGSCHIWVHYGYLSGSIFPLFVTLIVGDAFAIGYLPVYYRYTTEPTEVRKRLACLLSVECAGHTLYVLGE
uniref:Uncharacterized protein n=1 Tax=Globisporangium ultimum (strain ATCC 200006 / CBS 805.95 / DAOM BR144) TaxID=431595 RepID=K3XCX1_GLOUD